MEIPDTISYCKALQVADFSGNPLTRYGHMTGGQGLLLARSNRRDGWRTIFKTSFFGEFGFIIPMSFGVLKLISHTHTHTHTKVWTDIPI